MVPFSLCYHSHSSSSSSSPQLNLSHFTVVTTLSDHRKRHPRSCRFLVRLSTHSNPKIVKSNRRSRYGEPLSPYDDQAYRFADVSDDDWLLNDDFTEVSDFVVNKKKSKPLNGFANGHLNGEDPKGVAEKSFVRNYDRESKKSRETALDAARKGRAVLYLPIVVRKCEKALLTTAILNFQGTFFY